MKKLPTTPSVTLLCKLGSIVVHAEEARSSNGHPVDLMALDAGLKDAEVQAWIKDMGGLLPLKRRVSD